MPGESDAHVTATTPERLIDLASGAFSQLDVDHKRSITFGFVATLAVATLTSISFREAKRARTSTMSTLQGAALAAARRRAHDTSRSRLTAGEAFGSFVWRMFDEALAAMEAAERGDVRAKEAASSVFGGIDRYIYLYASASAEDLDRAGILQAARISDAELGGRQRPSSRTRKARPKRATKSVRSTRPNPITLTFPFFLAANGWWIHGWIGGLVAAGGYLALLSLINTAVVRWWLPDNAARFVRRFQTIKWVLFIAFIMGTSLIGLSMNRVQVSAAEVQWPQPEPKPS